MKYNLKNEERGGRQMPSKRDRNLKEFGISEFAYREMLYFCMQYEEKKNALKNIYSIGAVRYDKEKIKGKICDSVAQKAERAITLENDIKIIEEAAKQTDEFLWKMIIENVCYGVATDYLNIPCGRRQFYNKRKLFFVKLYNFMEERKKGHTRDIKVC